MQVNDQKFQESLVNWCKEIEGTWKPMREQLSNKIEEPILQSWEDDFLSFKKEVEKGTLFDDRLLKKGKELSDKLMDFYKTLLRESDVQAVPIGGHQLPPLPYAYNALEPVISEEIMRLHHLKHHQSYVNGLNKAERELKKSRENGNFDLIKHWERELAFNGAGHYLHTIFWTIMSPEGGGQPSNELSKAINAAFGSFDKFKVQFSQAAEHVEGGGWAILVWSPRAQRLEILTAEKHQNLTQWDVIPLLVLDVWEHAYYLQYKNERAKYIENWWGIVNWKEVGKRFNHAQLIRWNPY